jgi:hypothetical protein
MGGMPACRDVPRIVVAASREHFLLTEADLNDPDAFGGIVTIEPVFGIQQSWRHDLSPPSAFRGPFLPLLRLHPGIGIDFLVELFNHSSEWYVQRKFHSRSVSAAEGLRGARAPVRGEADFLRWIDQDPMVHSDALEFIPWQFARALRPAVCPYGARALALRAC